MRQVLAAVLCLVGLPISAHPQGADLRGQWLAMMPAVPSYSATLLIDDDGRVVWEAAWDPQQRRNYRGYTRLDGSIVELIVTDGIDKVNRVRCAVQSKNLLHCYNTLSNGKTSDAIFLTRVGPGPRTLMPAPR